MFTKLKDKFTYTQLIALSFFGIIIIGTILLCLPISSKTHIWTSVENSLFTATSATCVTGLVVFDTASYWSVFGKVVILCLIQVGGLGFMSVISMFSIFLKRRISLHERRLLMQSAGTMRISGVVKLMKRILIGTFSFEAIGALLLSIRFIPKMGFLKGVASAIFHSVSAFCNAGFDILDGASSSFTDYYGDVLVNLTLSALIIIGGIGFLVWNNIIKLKWNFKKYELHTKIVLVTTISLIFIGWILFFLFEKDCSMKGMNIAERIVASLFQSVTTRTAGFNTIDLSKLSETGNILTVFLMLIGGSPGSTAGGIKTTTLAVLILCTFAAAKHSNGVSVFKRKLDDGILNQATSVISVYLLFILVSSLIICAIEPFSAKNIIFEIVSAVGTVGLSVGITSSLSSISKLILIILMFAGRVGGLSLMLVLAEKRSSIPINRPTEKVLIG